MNGKQEREQLSGISASSLARWVRRDRDLYRAKRRAEERDREWVLSERDEPGRDYASDGYGAEVQ